MLRNHQLGGELALTNCGYSFLFLLSFCFHLKTKKYLYTSLSERAAKIKNQMYSLASVQIAKGPLCPFKEQWGKKKKETIQELMTEILEENLHEFSWSQAELEQTPGKD